MKKKLLIMSMLVLIGLFTLNINNAYTYDTSPPPSNTGAPGQATCGTNGSCHVGNNEINIEGGSIAIDFADGTTTYELNTTYSISVTIERDGSSRYGFQMVAFDENTESIGNFIGNATNLTESKLSADGFQYIQHKNVPNNNSNTFTFDWESPAEMSGNITFYVSGLAANGNNNSGGDFIYTGSLGITPFVETSMATIDAKNIHIYPNPTTDFINIDLPNTHIIGDLQLLDITGKQIAFFDKNVTQIPVSQYAKGTYFLQIPTTTQNIVEQIILK